VLASFCRYCCGGVGRIVTRVCLVRVCVAIITCVCESLVHPFLRDRYSTHSRMKLCLDDCKPTSEAVSRPARHHTPNQPNTDIAAHAPFRAATYSKNKKKVGLAQPRRPCPAAWARLGRPFLVFINNSCEEIVWSVVAYILRPSDRSRHTYMSCDWL